MNIWILLGAGIALGLAVVIMFARRLTRAQDDESTHGAPVHVTRNSPSRRRRQYYGVSIKAGVNTCDAVDRIRNQRFLIEDAPRFPLPGCTRADCRCVAVPEDDRRAASDRRRYSFTAYGDYNPNAFFEKREKVKRGRRANDTVE